MTLKVLMIGPYPMPGRSVSGGVERVIQTLLPVLGKRVQLTLLVPNADRDMEVSEFGVRVVYLKRTKGLGVLSYWQADARRIRDFVLKTQPDIVHLQGAGGWGRLVSSPRILTVHGIAHRDILTSRRGRRWGRALSGLAAQLVKVIEGRVRRAIGNVIVINPYVLDAYPDIAERNHWFVPNPADPVFTEFAADIPVAREKRIVIVGKVGTRKNTLEGVRLACEVLRDEPEASLSVAGDTSDKAYLAQCQAIASGSGVGDRVSFLGNLDTSDLVRLYDCASLLLMTSRQETAPMAIIEAQSRGVAVVAPACFGIPAMLKDGKNGRFLTNDGFEADVTLLRDALRNEWDRAEITEMARSAYSAKAVADATLKAYESVLGSRGA